MSGAEREARFKDIRERQGSREGWSYGRDIEFLLSEYDALAGEVRDWVSDPRTALYDDRDWPAIAAVINRGGR